MDIDDDERIELRNRVERAGGRADCVPSMIEHGQVLGERFA